MNSSEKLVHYRIRIAAAFGHLRRGAIEVVNGKALEQPFPEHFAETQSPDVRGMRPAGALRYAPGRCRRPSPARFPLPMFDSCTVVPWWPVTATRYPNYHVSPMPGADALGML